MVFFSTYRSARIVGPGTLTPQVNKMRAYADNYFGRPWSGSLQWALPGDMRMWAVGISFIYFYHRWHNDHTLESDNYEKSLILRWGGSLDEVRKLSPQDQLRARHFVDTEKLYSSYGPKDAIIQPAGDLLPGKDFYKQGAAH